MRALLDINLLLALFDADHIDHERPWVWMRAEVDAGWASCPIIQNGFVRSDALARLRDATDTAHHEFWPADLSILDERSVQADRIHSPKQVTDLYLLALAVRHDARFVTFDAAVPVSAVPGARPDHLIVL